MYHEDDEARRDEGDEDAHEQKLASQLAARCYITGQSKLNANARMLASNK